MKKPFTLIELLIVIAIIMILFAILLPLFSRTKEKTRRVLCVSNIRQVASAMVGYAKDNDGDLPAGNATLDPNHGIDSTYVVGPKRDLGVSFFVTYEYVNSAEVLYCPTWSHPYSQYDTVDTGNLDPWFGTSQMGGWPADGNSGPSRHRLISYHWRSTFIDGKTGPSFDMDNLSDTAVLADHFARRETLWGYRYGHRDAYTTLYLDGHAEIVHDNDAEYMRTKQPHSHSEEIHKCNKYTNGSWSFQEQIWQEFFDHK